MNTIKLFAPDGRLVVIQDRPTLIARYLADGYTEAPADAKPKKAPAKRKRAAKK